jgi:tetratricopeptide (TPR) repeat protein
MRGAAGAALALGLALAAAGCVTATAQDRTYAAAAPGSIRPRSLPEELVARHNDRSEAFERSGDLARALQERKIALTIDPGNGAAREGRARLETLIEDRVAQRVQQGRAALARGSHGEARRHFLVALALDPGNLTAFEALRWEVREVEVVIHTVRPGETLATLAQRYYGDQARSEVIAEANQLTPKARLTVGRSLKVPEIPGLPFARPEPRREVARAGATTKPGGREHRDEVPDTNPLLLDAQEALGRGAYPEALADAERLLASQPDNGEALAIKKQALYRQAQSQLAARSYGESYRSLISLTRLAPNYEDAAVMLQQARRALVDQHYSQGIRLFRGENLTEAIAEWRIVLELDPEHVNARRNIEQAERLLKSLEERRRR